MGHLKLKLVLYTSRAMAPTESFVLIYEGDNLPASTDQGTPPQYSVILSSSRTHNIIVYSFVRLFVMIIPSTEELNPFYLQVFPQTSQ